MEVIFLAIRIFIDQGHNPQGVNGGAVANGINEGELTYEVGIYLAELLENDSRFSVKTSRTSPEQILGTTNTTSLNERVTIANSWPADYFLSIHANASTNPNINGSEVYVYAPNTQAYWLAQHILNGLVTETGTFDNGVRVNPSLYVLRRTNMPANLIELGYLTNTGDAEKLKADPRAFAQGIYDGLLSFFGL